MTAPAAIPALLIPRHARCRDCDYLLRDLLSPRCPECGRPFDPADPRTMRLTRLPNLAARLCTAATRFLRRHIPSIRIFAVCATASWAIAYLLEGSFSLLFWTPLLYPLLRRRWLCALLVLLATPLAFECAIACHDYARGSPRYVRPDMTITWPPASTDPVTRISGHNPGCGTRSQNAWMGDLAEFTGPLVMFRLIGRPPGAYTGPYPTEPEALAATATAQSLAWDAIEKPYLTIGPTRINIDPDWFRPHYEVVDTPLPPGALPRAALWRQRCLIVDVPRMTHFGLQHDLHLIDTTTTRMFGLYWIQPPPPAPSP